MFFGGWPSLGRTFVLGILAYLTLIVILRATGKRTLSKMNAFDLVITVAFGSALSSILLTKSVTLADGVLALAMLAGLQYSVTWLSVRSEKIQKLVKDTPRMLFYKGNFLDDALKKERVTREEIMAAARRGGISDLGEVDAVILETDGSFSVLKNTGAGGRSTLDHVKKAA